MNATPPNPPTLMGYPVTFVGGDLTGSGMKWWEVSLDDQTSFTAGGHTWESAAESLEAQIKAHEDRLLSEMYAVVDYETREGAESVLGATPSHDPREERKRLVRAQKRLGEWLCDMSGDLLDVTEEKVVVLVDGKEVYPSEWYVRDGVLYLECRSTEQ